MNKKYRIEVIFNILKTTQQSQNDSTSIMTIIVFILMACSTRDTNCILLFEQLYFEQTLIVEAWNMENNENNCDLRNIA